MGKNFLRIAHLMMIRLVIILLILIQPFKSISQSKNHFSISLHAETSAQNLKWHMVSEFGQTNYRLSYDYIGYAARLWWSHPTSRSLEIGFFTSYTHASLDNGESESPAKYVGVAQLNGHLLKQSQYDTLKWYRLGTRVSAGYSFIGMKNLEPFLYDYNSLNSANAFGNGFNMFLEHHVSFQRKGIPLPFYLGIEYGINKYRVNKIRFQKGEQLEYLRGTMFDFHLAANLGWNF